jgi:hypothetical protein
MRFHTDYKAILCCRRIHCVTNHLTVSKQTSWAWCTNVTYAHTFAHTRVTHSYWIVAQSHFRTEIDTVKSPIIHIKSCHCRSAATNCKTSTALILTYHRLQLRWIILSTPYIVVHLAAKRTALVDAAGMHGFSDSYELMFCRLRKTQPEKWTSACLSPAHRLSNYITDYSFVCAA